MEEFEIDVGPARRHEVGLLGKRERTDLFEMENKIVVRQRDKHVSFIHKQIKQREKNKCKLNTANKLRPY